MNDVEADTTLYRRAQAALNTGDFEHDFRSWIISGVALLLSLVGTLLIIDDLQGGRFAMAFAIATLPASMMIALWLLLFRKNLKLAAETTVIALYLIIALTMAISGGQATGPYISVPLIIFLVANIVTPPRFAIRISVASLLLPLFGAWLATLSWDFPFKVDAQVAFWGLIRMSVVISLLALLCMLLFRKSSDRTRAALLQAQALQAHSQKLEAIGTLASGIAHEINTPIQYVSDNLSFINESCQDLRDCIEKLRKQIDSSPGGEIDALKKSTQEILDETDVEFIFEELPRASEEAAQGLSRVRAIVVAMKEFAHPGNHEKTMVDLNKAIASTLVVCANRWKYAADMETDYDEGLPSTFCLPDEVNQVVLNIVVNAADSIQEMIDEGTIDKGKISIATLSEDDFVEIRITDTGRGIPEEIRDRVFDPFFTTKEVGKGTGQGLAISYDVVVNRHGGELLCESAPGEGATFRIRLPRIDESALDKANVETTKEVSAEAVVV